jgi:aryl-alcohol dehydrogenase-like predicted oxidoreductase
LWRRSGRPSASASPPLISLQPQYSLIARAIEAEILPVCARHGLGTLVWGPLGGGILAGRYRRDADPQPDTRFSRLLASGEGARQWVRDQLTDRNLTIAEEVGKVAAELDTTPAAVALAWIRSRPGVTSVIIGPRTVEQLQHNLTGLELELPAELVFYLDEVSGPAPGPVTGVTVPL